MAFAFEIPSNQIAISITGSHTYEVKRFAPLVHCDSKLNRLVINLKLKSSGINPKSITKSTRASEPKSVNRTWLIFPDIRRSATIE
jgi:hypothetical protein